MNLKQLEYKAYKQCDICENTMEGTMMKFTHENSYIGRNERVYIDFQCPICKKNNDILEQVKDIIERSYDENLSSDLEDILNLDDNLHEEDIDYDEFVLKCSNEEIEGGFIGDNLVECNECKFKVPMEFAIEGGKEIAPSWSEWSGGDPGGFEEDGRYFCCESCSENFYEKFDSEPEYDEFDDRDEIEYDDFDVE
ncbi:MAG: hypothetical protein ACRCX2_10050 [Paraclostridium sp.]